MERWTRNDEYELMRLSRKKDELIKEHSSKIRNVVENLHLFDSTIDYIVETMMANSHTIREVLSPFDDAPPEPEPKHDGYM